MKIYNLFLLLFLVSCIGAVDVAVEEDKFSAGITDVTALDIQNNEVTISGDNLLGTSEVRIVGGSVDHLFTVSNVGKTSLKAHASSSLNLAVDTIYTLILTNGFGQAAFPISFDLTDDSVTTAKIADGAVTGAKISDAGAADGDVLKYDSFSGTWIPAVDVGAGAGGGTVTNLVLGRGLVTGTITVAGTVNLDTGTEAGTLVTVGVDKIPFINASNELTLTNNGKLKLDGVSGNMSILNDGTFFSIYDEDATADRVTVDAASGDVTISSNLIVNSSATVAGQTVCLGNGVGCPVTGGGTVTSITAGTGLTAAPGSPITTTGTLNVNVGTSNGQIAQVGAGNVLPTSIIPVLPITQGGTGATTALAARAALGLTLGATVQTWSARLDDIGVLAATDNNFIVGNGANFVLETAATARTSMGLGTAATLDAGSFPFNVVQLDGAGNLPAIDGSALTGLPLGYWNQVGADINYVAGNVGIGTATPASPLEINVSVPQILTLKTNASDQGYIEYFTDSADQTDRTAYVGFPSAGSEVFSINSEYANGEIGLYTAGTLRVNVKNDGNVGMGTAAPAGDLHVSDDAATSVFFSEHANVVTAPQLHFRKSRGTAAVPGVINIGDEVGRMEGQAYTAGAGYDDVAAIVFRNDGAFGAGDSPGAISFQTATDGSNITTEKMVITNDGRVGIGEPAPDATSLLEVAGDIHAARICSNAGLNCRDLSLPAPTDGHSLDADDANPLNALYVDSNGDVGIGTIAPASADLHLFRTATDAILKVESDTTDAVAMLKANDNRISIIFMGDTSDDDIGSIQYNHNTEQMSFETNDVTERMIIDGAGQVGINLGGAPAEAHLHVNADAAVTGALIESSDTTADISFKAVGQVMPNLPKIGAENASLILSNVSGERMRYEGDKAGLGTTAIGVLAPTATLHLGSTDTVVAKLETTNINSYMEFSDAASGGAGPRIGSEGTKFIINDTSGKAITVDGGAVGIGTATPLNLLELQGGNPNSKLVIRNTSPPVGIFDGFELIGISNLVGAGTGLVFKNTDAVLAEVPYAGIAGQTQTVGNGTHTGNLLFNTAQGGTLGTKMVLDSAGRLGVGISTAAGITQTLTVAGDIRIGNAGSNGCLEDFSGGVLNGVCSSDERFKKEIKPLDSLLEALVKVIPSTYHWRSDEFPERNWGSSEQVGLIAQQVQKHFPSLVSTDKNGFLRVDYSKLPLLLLQGLREEFRARQDLGQSLKNLIEENLELKNKMMRRDQTIDDLEKRLSKLESLIGEKK